MSGYDQTITIKPEYYLEAKNFFAFLQAVGRRYSRSVKIRYRYLKQGSFYVIVDGSSGGIDALLQELILNKGLYYYCCSLRNNKKKDISRNVVIPIFRELLEYRFENPYSRFLWKHITGKISQDDYIPADFCNPFSHEYEVLFRKWDIKALDDWNFIKDVDSFLTKFMLKNINHESGKRSPPFHVLVEQVYKKGVGMAKDTKGLFNKIHVERTLGLHRLMKSVSREKISNLAFQIYNYFQYFDEFQESQRQKTEKLHGKIYRRIKYGDEQRESENFDGFEFSKHPCHDCGAIRGQYHCFGCDVEQCPRCKGQFLGCECKLDEDYD
jgi:hypothetical protein